jgi:hypothetical protein
LGNESTFKANQDFIDLYILVNHWKSKSQDSDSTEYTLPRRLEQAHFVAALVDQLSATDPE